MVSNVQITRSVGSPVAYVVADISRTSMRITHVAHLGLATLVADEWCRGVYLVPGRIQKLRT